MPTRKAADRERRFGELLARDHTLNGGVLVGIDGHFIEFRLVLPTFYLRLGR